MANQLREQRYTNEQREAWAKAKYLLHELRTGHPDALNPASRRALHIAMSEMRAEQGRKHKGPIETLPKHEQKRIQHEAIKRDLALNERVAAWKAFLMDPSSKKLYILIDHTLSPAQKAVQASHAAAQFQKEHPFAPWINGTMVLLECKNKDFTNFRGPISMEEWARRNHWIQPNYGGGWPTTFTTLWSEPDLDNRLTAIAATRDFRTEELGSSEQLRLI
jgi:hypothetical protein